MQSHFDCQLSGHFIQRINIYHRRSSEFHPGIFPEISPEDPQELFLLEILGTSSKRSSGKILGNSSRSFLEIPPGVPQEFLQEFLRIFFLRASRKFHQDFSGNSSWSSSNIPPRYTREFIQKFFGNFSRRIFLQMILRNSFRRSSQNPLGTWKNPRLIF